LAIFKTKTHLPDSWGKQAACPSCGHHGLEIAHSEGLPDHMACIQCGIRFEMEDGGPHIHMIRTPDALTGIRAPGEQGWISIEQLHEMLHRAHEPQPTPQQAPPDLQAMEQPPPPPGAAASTDIPATKPASEKALPDETPAEEISVSTPEEAIIARARKLADLGNRPERIRSILERSGATPEQVQTALQAAAQVQREKKTGLGAGVWIVLGIVFVIVVLAAGTLVVRTLLPLWQVRSLLAATAIPSATPRPSETPMGVSTMSQEAKAYFKVVWGLNGDFNQKADQLAAATSPTELADLNQQLISAYREAGQSVADDETCRQVMASCGTGQGQTPCPDWNCFERSATRTEIYQRLADLWNKTAAPVWLAYYQLNNEPFPIRSYASNRIGFPLP
jgi:hypothetical protein